MSTNRSRRIDRETAEHLLGRAVVGASAGQAPLTGHEALAGMLAAAAAPAVVDGELPGESAALAAFREARSNPVQQPGRRTMASTAMARTFSMKAVAAAFAATALGGVAFAAGTGTLPVVLGGGRADDIPAVVSTGTDSASPSAGPTTHGRGNVTTAPTGTMPSLSTGPRTSPNPTGAGDSGDPGQPVGSDGQVVQNGQAGSEAVRLCQVYSDRMAGGGKLRVVLADPALAVLVKAAGGANRVDGYCATLTRPGPGNPTGTPPPQGPDDRTKGPSDPPIKAQGGRLQGFVAQGSLGQSSLVQGSPVQSVSAAGG